MNKFLTILLMACPFVASAQDKTFSFGITTSLDWNSYALYDEEQSQIDYSGRLCYSAGFIMTARVTEKFSIKSGLIYSRKSFSELTDYSYLQDHPLLKNNKYKRIFVNHFIDAPVFFRYHKTGQIDNYPFIGLINSFRVGYKLKGDVEPNNIYGGVKYNRHLLSTAIGWGFQTDIGRVGMTIEPQCRIYLTDVHEEYVGYNPIYFGVEVALMKL